MIKILKNFKNNKEEAVPKYMTLNASLNDTNLIAKVPINWFLMILNAVLPFYLLTQNLILSTLLIVTLYAYGFVRTQENTNWSKNIKRSILFRCYLISYITLIILAAIKIFNL